MGKQKRVMAALVVISVICFGCFVSVSGMAHDKHGKGGGVEKGGEHGILLWEKEDEGSETAGQISAWLLVVANFSVVLSILIKWIDRFLPLGDRPKSLFMNFNRFQKKHLMVAHYYLNPVVLGVVVWHYMSSRCRSTSLPEWGLVLMVCFMTFGILVKFRLCPKVFRKRVYQIHTQPMILVVMVLVLTVGHLIVD